jgi:hypothetical protein
MFEVEALRQQGLTRKGSKPKGFSLAATCPGSAVDRLSESAAHRPENGTPPTHCAC